MNRHYRDEDWLHNAYCIEELTQREIAEICDVSVRTIRRYMDQFNIDSRDIEGEHHPLYGEERTEETKRKISETLEGRELTPEWRSKIADSQQGRVLSEDVRNKIASTLSGRNLSDETRRKMSHSTSGPQNPNWRGGYSRYYGADWSLRREEIQARDEVCVECDHDGSQRRLEVHHIIPVRVFRDSPDYKVRDAHKPDNLVLLCNRCHTKADHGLLDFKTEIDAPDTV